MSKVELGTDGREETHSGKDHRLATVPTSTTAPSDPNHYLYELEWVCQDISLGKPSKSPAPAIFPTRPPVFRV